MIQKWYPWEKSNESGEWDERRKVELNGEQLDKVMWQIGPNIFGVN